jgi:RHS repeat-associated protein
VSSNGVPVLANAYDWRHRRVRKAAPAAAHAFVYDGWNPVQETVVPVSGPVSTRRNYWGLDLSGTLQGAGGVGGLLAVDIDGQLYFPCYDNNGNVMEYVDASGAVRARYGYSPFGKITAQSGDLADMFRFRFSTKYCDAETGLYYYGYRFYAPAHGRWLNRDPIEERGGPNLYGFCGNDPLTCFDLLGAKIESLTVRGSGQSKLDASDWRGAAEATFKSVIGNANLGFNGGYGTYQPAQSWWPFSKKPKPMTIPVGLFKFEYEAVQVCPYIDPRDRHTGNFKNFTFRQYVSNASRKWTDESGNVSEDAVSQRTGKGEQQDGPSLFVALTGETGSRIGQFAGDAPRTPYPYGGNTWPGINGTFKYSFEATFRIRAEDNDNAFEAVFKVSYQFDSANPQAGQGELTITTPPHEVK